MAIIRCAILEVYVFGGVRGGRDVHQVWWRGRHRRRMGRRVRWAIRFVGRGVAGGRGRAQGWGRDVSRGNAVKGTQPTSAAMVHNYSPRALWIFTFLLLDFKNRFLTVPVYRIEHFGRKASKDEEYSIWKSVSPSLRHDFRAKIAFFEENDLMVSSLRSFSNGWTGENCVKKLPPKVGKKVHETFLVALTFNTKLYRNFAVSQRLFFVPSQELISRTESWKKHKLGKTAHQYVVSKIVLGIFQLPSPSHCLLPYFRKSRSILKHENV